MRRITTKNKSPGHEFPDACAYMKRGLQDDVNTNRTPKENSTREKGLSGEDYIGKHHRGESRNKLYSNPLSFSRIEIGLLDVLRSASFLVEQTEAVMSSIRWGIKM